MIFGTMTGRRLARPVLTVDTDSGKRHDECNDRGDQPDSAGFRTRRGRRLIVGMRRNVLCQLMFTGRIKRFGGAIADEVCGLPSHKVAALVSSRQVGPLARLGR